MCEIPILILRILLEQNTALLSTVRVSVTGVTSHIFHIYKGINAMLIIRENVRKLILKNLAIGPHLH